MGVGQCPFLRAGRGVGMDECGAAVFVALAPGEGEGAGSEGVETEGDATVCGTAFAAGADVSAFGDADGSASAAGAAAAAPPDARRRATTGRALETTNSRTDVSSARVAATPRIASARIQRTWALRFFGARSWMRQSTWVGPKCKNSVRSANVRRGLMSEPLIRPPGMGPRPSFPASVTDVTITTGAAEWKVSLPIREQAGNRERIGTTVGERRST